ncbi:hypothetical protein BG011_005627 [Mortierella polycephala]|uniref:Uncharacterized protein n=1 Tax=Mortierella polycephala TaxID=41804 RepID=A0A9P6PY66_9FUNG|nr:hypothetical protein BG011_005627 [Mortierella polycephala]
MTAKEARINYGNMNQAQGTTYELAQAEKAGALMNADVDIGKLDYMGRSKYAADVDDWEKCGGEYGAANRDWG